MTDLIYRQEALDALCETCASGREDCALFPYCAEIDAINSLPSVEQEKEKPRRVLWTGWKGYRDTRYRCPLCNKPVKNDDVYCHRCGQKLMFPKVDWTPYVEGQKQELIVRWDDE